MNFVTTKLRKLDLRFRTDEDFVALRLFLHFSSLNLSFSSPCILHHSDTFTAEGRTGGPDNCALTMPYLRSAINYKCYS
jgi:hypothetical protein